MVAPILPKRPGLPELPPTTTAAPETVPTLRAHLREHSRLNVENISLTAITTASQVFGYTVLTPWILGKIPGGDLASLPEMSVSTVGVIALFSAHIVFLLGPVGNYLQQYRPAGLSGRVASLVYESLHAASQVGSIGILCGWEHFSSFVNGMVMGVAKSPAGSITSDKWGTQKFRYIFFRQTTSVLMHANVAVMTALGTAAGTGLSWLHLGEIAFVNLAAAVVLYALPVRPRIIVTETA